MRRIWTCILAATVTCALVGAANASASAVEPKVLRKDRILTRKSGTSPADDFRGNNKRIEAGPYIRKFKAERQAERIFVTAILGNLGNQPTGDIQYKISRRIARRWITVKNGTVSLAAREKRDVSCELTPTNNKVRLRIDIHWDFQPADGMVRTKADGTSNKSFKHPMKHDAATFALDEVGDEVYYNVPKGTKKWSLAYEKKNDVDGSGRSAAQEHARTLEKFGFETKLIVKDRKDSMPLENDSKTTVQLWARAATDGRGSVDTARLPDGAVNPEAAKSYQSKRKTFPFARRKSP